MNRKNISLCIVMIFSMFVFAGCIGAKDEGDKRFTYDWKAYSMTNNGLTT